jgi:hypothetical protein
MWRRHSAILFGMTALETMAAADQADQTSATKIVSEDGGPGPSGSIKLN